MINKTFIKLLVCLSALSLTIIGGNSYPSMAQNSTFQVDSVWSEPINVSHSGSTSNPQLIIDSQGDLFAVWVDKFNGYMATSSTDGNNWSQTTPVNFPFSSKEKTPVLIPDSLGHILAFWTDRNNELFYSRVTAEKFTDGAAWEPIQLIAGSAVNFDAVIDDNGNIHVAYVRILSTPDAPSGIYYRISSDNGVNWNNSQALDQSQYFRTLTHDDTNVKLATSQDGYIYVVWDNRPLKRIYFIKSSDGGISWNVPQTIKGPENQDGNNIPFGINIAGNGDGIIISWQSGQPNANCDQLSQWSIDKGDSWSGPQIISQGTYSCSPDTTWFVLQDGLLLLESNIEEQTVLRAWNGVQWSYSQNIPTSFTDPETYNFINFRGQQTSLGSSTQLYVIGYDEGGIGDTWLTSLSLESIHDWFPSPSYWNKPEVIHTTPNNITSTSIVVDENEQFHVLWIQSDRNAAGETNSIYYTKWDGIDWTLPQAIYTATQGNISQLDTVVIEERILIVWSEGLNEQILYSWSNINTAQNPSEWAAPLQLSTPRFPGKSPKILADNSDVVYVAYSKPINEDRGIYFVKSTDGGKNWSDPHQVFNAEAAGWEIADAPELATDENSTINIIWTKKSFPEDGTLLALYSSQSEDQGLSWSDPSIITEGDLTWGQIYGIHNRNLYRIWQEVDVSTQLVNWYQVTIDNGIQWSLPTSVTDPEANIGSPVVTTDNAGRLYLFQPIQLTAQISAITSRIWDFDRWLVEDRIFLENHYEFIPDTLAAAISSSGNLSLIYIEKDTDAATGSINYTLSYVSQGIDIPIVESTPVPQTNIEPTQIPIMTAMPSESLNPTTTFAINQEEINRPSLRSTNYPVIGLILGSSLLIGISAIFIVYKKISRNRIK